MELALPAPAPDPDPRLAWLRKQLARALRWARTKKGRNRIIAVLAICAHFGCRLIPEALPQELCLALTGNLLPLPLP